MATSTLRPWGTSWCSENKLNKGNICLSKFFVCHDHIQCVLYIGKLSYTSMLSDMSCSLYTNLKHALR